MAYSTVATGDRILASTINDIIQYGLNRPTVRLVQSAAQSMPDNTQTALTFTGTEDIDTHGFHDPTTNSSRITPNVAGLYVFWGAYYTGAATTPVSIDCCLRKNAATATATGSRDTLGTIATSSWAEAVFEMNGTTDYVELVGLQDSSGAVNSNVSLRFTSHFSCYLLRYAL